VIRKPRGTRDFSQEEMKKRRLIEEKITDVCKRFGYQEVATPTFEHAELFTRRSGSSIVNQMYTFLDKGGRELALRPEFTAQIMRFYENELRERPKPLKLYYFGNCFRYEEPQKGRYREFWQFGAEIVGGNPPTSDVEIISLAVECLKNINLKSFELRIGHVGILRHILTSHGLKIEKQGVLMPFIDKGDVVGLRNKLEEFNISKNDAEKLVGFVTLKGDASILDKLEKLLNKNKETLSMILKWRETLELLNIIGITQYTIDIGIARGLDYYTGIVFEIDAAALGAEKQICGGGAYSLSDVFETEHPYATGFSIGFDRVLLALEKEGFDVDKRINNVYVAPITDGKSDVQRKAFEIVYLLRRNGIHSEIDLVGRNINKSLGYADSIGAKYAVIIGGDELRKDVAIVKNMENGEQIEVKLRELVTYFAKKFS
jgi:histidyl-tRNA synthetase